MQPKKPPFTAEQKAFYDALVGDVGHQLLGLLQPFLEGFFRERIIAPVVPPPIVGQPPPQMGPPPVPYRPVIVERMDESGFKVQVPVTVPQLLAEIADHLRYVIFVMEQQNKR